MNICILGRQPDLSLAELERLFGSNATALFGGGYAFVDAPVNINRLGGTVKTAVHLASMPVTNPQKIFGYLQHELPRLLHRVPSEGKIKLGVSLYGFDMSPAKINANALSLKKSIKNVGRSVRVVPNTEAALSSAQSYHNNLAGELGLELIAIKNGNEIVLGQLTGVQNIDALAARDQARPKTDAFVGMLPPKLALMMVNLAGGREAPASFSEDSAFPAAGPQDSIGRQMARLGSEENYGRSPAHPMLLDPFCGTGVVLQEAALLGYNVYGTDLSEKMVDYSSANLKWAKEKFGFASNIDIHHGNAIETKWHQPIDVVACETYLGQPFSAPPSPEKLAQVRGICNEIITKFLLNLAPQIKKGTPLCLAVPAWRDHSGYTTYLPLIPQLEELGYEFVPLKRADNKRLLYYREDQVVARQLLVLKRS